MGQKEREQIYNAVSTIKKTMDAIDNLKNNLEEKEVSTLLEECQECASAIDSKLELLYGEDVSLIKNLESLCDIGEYQEKLQNTLKKEVVFLPYKASMWDSLESVWRAASEDESCITRVIPIPYYDKSPDGSFKKMYWEGDMFPDYVPITRYDEYDLEEHRPDMIFIHNPYDECNIVTSVHPDYYSSRIKAFTDKLVYIPYFILDEIRPSDRELIELKKHYCLLPGVIHSDCVVVQSEDMRTIYINVLSEYYGEYTRPMWEKKIKGFGSPKVDKVLSTEKDKMQIPEEWKKIVKNADGEWKKVILYNVSLTTLLNRKEDIVDKIENTLTFFEKNQDEVALLWRPHPLYLSTMDSMCPMLSERYKSIVKKYREAGWGIYDDTSDLNRAIALSDAYYGDASSVARLYEKAGKKVLFQNPTYLN